MSEWDDGFYLKNLRDTETTELSYRPCKKGPCVAQNATCGVKFGMGRVILDDWHIVGGTRWTRTKMRLRHPIIYSKRGLRNLYRRIKYLFVKPRMIQPLARHPHAKQKGK